MARPKFYNLVGVATATTGTGTLTLGSAAPGRLTFAQAGASNGDVVRYAIADGANSEVGIGTYSTTGPTLTRDVVSASTNSGSKISCSGSASVSVTFAAEDAASATVGAWSYWRLRDLRHRSNVVGFQEIEFRATISGSPVAPTSVSASTELDGSNVAANGVDSNTATGWHAAFGDTCPWYQAYFATPQVVAELAITTNTDGVYYVQAPSAFDLMVSDDGVTFYPITSFDYSGWSAGSTQTFAVPAKVH